jgi:thiol-disulfide isomerase/thioredoxin/outer membrane lipoprotein-sorting protein
MARWLVTLLMAGAPSASLWAQAETAPHSTPAGALHSAAEILESAIEALAPVRSVEYSVRTIPADPAAQAGTASSGHTVVIAAIGAPIRYRARFQSESPAAVELAVSDGEMVRISAAGQLSEYPTRTMEDRGSAAALPTLPSFDPGTYRKALANKSAVYAGQDDIEGDPCYVVASPSLLAEEVGSDTTYYWISARTGLPRSKQTYRIFHGKTYLTYRWVISDIQLNPTIEPDTFTYRPTADDSRISTKSAETVKPNKAVSAEEKAAASLVGQQVPDLEVRDAEYKPVSLAEIAKGKATILTLWATWCAPCVAEFPAFQAVLDRHPGELQVVALATQDSRLNVLSFIKKHPEYQFLFLTDPHPEDNNSAIAKFFFGEAVPRNAFIDPKGKIVEYRMASYEDKPDELRDFVDTWISELKLAH